MIVRVLRTAAGAVVAVAGVLALATLILPRLVGWTPYVVTSASMEPTFGAGALVLSAAVEPDDVEAGDVVTFETQAGLTTHRVVRSSGALDDSGAQTRALTTQGDANEEPDPELLDPRNVVGQARFAIPHVGHAVELLKTPLGLGLVTTLFVTLALTGGRRGDRSPADREPARSLDERELARS